jgi:aryl-alcohol dehydrogenase-like predicted oxidoreductase
LFGDTHSLEVRHVQLDDPAALAKAFDGVSTAFLAMGSIGIEANLQPSRNSCTRIAAHSADESTNPGKDSWMERRILGATGISVSEMALGAMMFGAGGNPDHGESARVIQAALDAGINLVDTADAYSAGESETIVGQAIKGRRDDVVLATKFCLPMGEDPNRSGGSRRWIMQAGEDSLRRLGTDHIDLYQMHRPDPATPVEESLSALSDLVHAGKVRAIGSSTFPAELIVEAQWAAERRGYERFLTEQPRYSILNRGPGL